MEHIFRACYRNDFVDGILPEGLMFFQHERDDQLWFVNKFVIYPFYIPFWDKDWIVSQYIGVKDNKKKKIYNGDILETNEAGWKAKVVYKYGGFILVDNPGGFSVEPQWNKCKIIGNVWQSPELLEVADDKN